MILYPETDPLLIGNDSDEIVLLDVIAYTPEYNLRVGDQIWASGSGVSEAVEDGFLAYHSGSAKVAKLKAEPDAPRQKRKYTRRVPIGTTNPNGGQ